MFHNLQAYAAVKANDPRALQRRLREAESSFPVNVGARNGAGLTMLHIGERVLAYGMICPSVSHSKEQVHASRPPPR